jgi:hypothetical protein
MKKKLTKAQLREVNLRRKALRRGLVLSKSRRRDRDALDYKLYSLTDAKTNVLVSPPIAGLFAHSLTIDDVEAYLTDDKRKQEIKEMRR